MNLLNLTKDRLINPDEIDLNDHTIYFPAFSLNDNLRKSIREAGIINPPVVKECPDGRLIPVLGRRRIQTALEIGLSPVAARVLPHETPVSDAYETAFWDNISHRRFDDSLKSVILARLLELFPLDRVCDAFLRVLGINPYGPLIEKFRAIGTLDHETLELLSAGRILTKTAFTITKMVPEDREFIRGLSRLPGMNANKFDEVTQSLYDLSIIRNITVRKVVEHSKFKEILLSTQIAGNSKTEELRNLIRNWKFPELAQSQDVFQTWIKSVSLPENISVSHTPSFEDENLTISVSVNSYDEASRILDRLGVGVGNPRAWDND